MKRTISILSILSLAFVMTATTFAKTPSTERSQSEHLNKQQLNTLIATASTPAEHRLIAQYYQTKALDYAAQAQEHEQMIEAYNANPSRGGKSRASFIDHCEYSAKHSKDLATKSQELAQLHEQMAKDAEQK